MAKLNIEDGEFSPEVEAAIAKVFSDKSVSQTVTWQHLDNIIAHVHELCDSLTEADQNQ